MHKGQNSLNINGLTTIYGMRVMANNSNDNDSSNNNDGICVGVCFSYSVALCDIAYTSGS